MRKPNSPSTSSNQGPNAQSANEPRPVAAPQAVPEPTPVQRGTAVLTNQEQATIGKSLVIKGEVTGSESLYIDGKVEGSINLQGNRVTVGRNGQVTANITAREIIVLGKVRGNVNASDRVDIRSEGSLSGDVVAQRISIEDGAFFKGGIDIRKPGNEKSADAKPNSVATQQQESAKAVSV